MYITLVLSRFHMNVFPKFHKNLLGVWTSRNVLETFLKRCIELEPTWNQTETFRKRSVFAGRGPRKPSHKFADWKMYDVPNAPPPPHTHTLSRDVDRDRCTSGNTWQIWVVRFNVQNICGTKQTLQNTPLKVLNLAKKGPI